ncbi:MAG TPA: hypothetical protein PLZ75_08835 [Bacteroidales bacterium]|jgi:hypothetical protein|nr:hypothetical protein [Bacteroidales bacterium]HQH25318.1 hypothetical protein [Bacteroidales bacterium]HQJ82460.1 hypothetical protein [Bacteroidales bacterium]
MIRKPVYLTTLILIFLSLNLSGRTDSIPPLPPALERVTVNPESGNVEIEWQTSPSGDVWGYVVYRYIDGAGYAIDTLYGRQITNYLHTGSGASYYSESYVVAAFDSVKNFSKLSRPLGTIYTEVRIDTCNNRLEVKWNSYTPVPYPVTDYSVMMSVDGEPFHKAGETEPENNLFILNEFITERKYCFFVRAGLANGQVSESNSDCVLTRMQKAPAWINADYASAGDKGRIKLSFTIDPGSEITTFRLERKTAGENDFRVIKYLTSVSSSVTFTDNEAERETIHVYRLAAVNNCGVPVKYSNTASNIVLRGSFSDNRIDLSWNSYRKWAGIVDSYIISAGTGGEYRQLAVTSPADTLWSVNYPDIMHEISGKEVCFMVTAFEALNPHGLSGESSSFPFCLSLPENITVPNMFIPSGTGVKETNRYFRPVLSFIPADYHLIVTDLKRRVIFETRDFNEKWDGRLNGAILPEGVYLWMLRIKTPSGTSVSRTGTVTLKNQ